MARIKHGLTFVIDRRKPNHIPMHRLAEYMAQFAAMLGDMDNIHFERIETGSTELHARAAHGSALGRARSRIADIRRGHASRDSQKAYNEINSMLDADQDTARLKAGGGVLLHFPGMRRAHGNGVRLVDNGTITGEIYSLKSDRNGKITALIRRESGPAIKCTANLNLKLKLKDHLFSISRIYGRGVWVRRKAADWYCESFNIHDISEVRTGNLRDAIEDLRSIDSKWPSIEDIKKSEGVA